MIKFSSKGLSKLIYVPRSGGFVLVQARGMFMVSFDKETSKNIFEKCTVSVGLSKTGKVLPILTIKALFELIAYDSNPKPSLSNFSRLYQNFVINPANSEYILDQKHITFGKGGHKKASLNRDGLKLFINQNKVYFQVSSETIDSFMFAFIKEFKSIADPVSDDYLYTELQLLLLTKNVFYIIEQRDLSFSVGYTLDTLKALLKNHPVYNSPEFKGFYTLFKVKDSNSGTLTKDFVTRFNVIVNIKKQEIERCGLTNDFRFKVNDSREIQHTLNLCFLNSDIKYNIEPVINTALLNALADYKNDKSEIFKKFK